MLAILISWITLLIVQFYLGDLFIHLYNKLCNNKEQYGFLDTFFLGMCFILIPLQFTSLWLPSNHYILLAYIIICIAYWACNKERTKEQIRKITDLLNSLTLFQKILICIALLAVIFHSLFLSYLCFPNCRDVLQQLARNMPQATTLMLEHDNGQQVSIAIPERNLKNQVDNSLVAVLAKIMRRGGFDSL